MRRRKENERKHLFLSGNSNLLKLRSNTESNLAGWYINICSIDIKRYLYYEIALSCSKHRVLQDNPKSRLSRRSISKHHVFTK